MTDPKQPEYDWAKIYEQVKNDPDDMKVRIPFAPKRTFEEFMALPPNPDNPMGPPLGLFSEHVYTVAQIRELANQSESSNVPPKESPEQAR